jgi:hypothetical protein
MANDTVTRIFGGSPLAVLGRLVLVSILVGVILSALGLDPFDIIRSVERLIRSIWNLGFDAFHWLWRYFLLGADRHVIPITGDHAAGECAARYLWRLTAVMSAASEPTIETSQIAVATFDRRRQIGCNLRHRSMPRWASPL